MIVGTVVADQVSSVSNIVAGGVQHAAGGGETPAEVKLDRLQILAERPRPRQQVNIRTSATRRSTGSSRSTSSSTPGKAVGIAQGVAIGVFESLFNVVLVIVISIYMLLDAPGCPVPAPPVPRQRPGDDLIARVREGADRLRPRPDPVSLVIGATAGVGCWILGADRHLPERRRLRLAFGAWAAVTEVIPYVGPWLGRDPAAHRGADPVARGGARGRRCCSCSSTRSRATSSSPS